MGTVSNAENPIATVVAEMMSVRPACPAAYRQPAGIVSLVQCFTKAAHNQQRIVDAKPRPSIVADSAPESTGADNAPSASRTQRH